MPLNILRQLIFILAALLSGAILVLAYPNFDLHWISWIGLIPLLLVILMQFRPEGIMGNKELGDIFPWLKKFYKFK